MKERGILHIMKLTKYEHACLVLEEQGQKLIIDPGVFSVSCTDFTNVAGVVVTHVHPDHFDTDKLTAVISQNPGAVIFTVQVAAAELDSTLPVTIVTGNEQQTAGPFTLDFTGGEHAVIHPSYPTTQNVGVMVNKALYYPGDSFALPPQAVDVLAVPASAPWLKLSEAMDFITAVKPKRVFPTHNAILSDIGAGIYDRLLEAAAGNTKAEYVKLKSGDFLEV